MNIRNKLMTLGIFCVLTTGALSATGTQETPTDGKGPVVVGSKIDTEGSLLGNVIKLVLENDGFTVVDQIQFGTTDVIRKGIASGEIDIYPEYTGNGAFFYGDAGIAPQTWKNRQAGYEAVAKLDREAIAVEWLTPAPANNTWAIALRSDVAEPNGLVTLSDLAAYLNDGGEFKIAASEEFVSRPDTLPAFESTYGFKLTEDQLLVVSSGNTAFTEQTAAAGTDGVNAAMAYGTDGQLAALGLVVLEDNLEVQPVYEPAPIVRGEVLEAYPEIASLLEPVFLSLDLVTLQTLNGYIAVEGRNAEDVAREYLVSKGFL